MLSLRLVLITILLVTLSGCTWTRIPAPPVYINEATIPLRVGVVLANNKLTMLYGTGVVSEWNKINLFKSILFPYYSNDSVDAVITLDIKGQWTGSGFGAGILAGLTLGLASPFVGPSMTGTHDAQADFTSTVHAVGSYSVKVETPLEWGLGADASAVGKQADVLQIKRIAFALASKIREDQQNLFARMRQYNKPGSELGAGDRPD